MAIFKRNKTINRSNQKSWYLSPANEDEYVSLAAQVAEKAADLIWGRGFEITSESEGDEEAIKALIKHNLLDELFYTLEMDLSQRGNIFAGVFLSEGKPTVLLSDSELISQRGGAFVSMDAAVTWHRIAIDNASFPVQVVWDRKTMKMNFVNGEGKTISVQQALKKVPEDKWPKTYWEHNLGVVPVVHFKNKPGAFRMYSRPDHAWTGALEQWFNKALWNFNEHEIDANLTKIYANLDIKDKRALKKQAKDMGMPLDEFLENIKTLVKTDFAGDKSGDNSNPPIQLIQSKLPANEWWHHIQQLKAEFFETSGYSYSRPEKSSLPSTATDVLFTSARDMQITKTKSALRQKQINELLDIMQKVFNKFSVGTLGELSIDIKGNIFNDSMAEVDKSEKKLNLGLSTKTREIMKLEAVSLAEAEEIASDAAKEVQEKMETEANIAPEEPKGDE